MNKSRKGFNKERFRMEDILRILKKRHSVRKFKDTDVPLEDIKRLIEAATLAPSGKNMQNWHFVVIRNKRKIAEIADIVIRKDAELAAAAKTEETKKKIQSAAVYHTVFKNAPVLILTYAGPYPVIGEALQAEGALPGEAIDVLLRPHPGIQNIAAAMENLLLAAADMGYGTCWMTGPTCASQEITQYINFHKEGYHLAALTPLGVPASEVRGGPPRKPLEEVMTVIE